MMCVLTLKRLVVESPAVGNVVAVVCLVVGVEGTWALTAHPGSEQSLLSVSWVTEGRSLAALVSEVGIVMLDHLVTK